MSQVGRISGPLLTANLERNGINLTFRNTSSDTQLLFLDVNSGKIGVNKGTAGYELDVNGTSRSSNLLSTTSTIANYTIDSNNLNVLVGDIYLNAAEAIKLSNFETDNIHISDNAISSYRSNSNIDLKPFGAGLPPNDGVVTSTFAGGEAAVQKDLFGEARLVTDTVVALSATWIAIQTLEPGDAGIITAAGIDYPFTLTSWSSIDREEAVIDIPTLANGFSSFDLTITLRPIAYKTTEIVNDLEVLGNLNATGNITADGNIIIGDSDTDSVTFNADIANNIIPAANDAYAIGSPTKRWDNLYTNLLNGNGISAGSLIAQGGGDFSLRQGNIFFVSVNGSDAASGDNVQAPFLTVKRALEAADASTAGPVTIQIFAGDYEEQFPLTVPSNVTVQGVDMRNTIIKPTVATQYNDAFLLNGESTVQHLTIKDFYSNITSVEIDSSNVINNPDADGVSNSDLFGQAVAISGNYAIVGAWGEDAASVDRSGKAYIFNATTGALIHTLDNPRSSNTSNDDYFGRSVSIDGNYAIVGAYQEDAGGGVSQLSSGKAYIFNVTTGALVHTLDNPSAYGTVGNDNFGWSVAISGNYAIVGAHFEDDGGTGLGTQGGSGLSSGKAYIFNVTSGALVHTLDNPNAYGTSAGDYFGYAVAIDSNYAIVGAHFEDDADGFSSGKAYIYNVTTGALIHSLDNPNVYDISQQDYFGWRVAISGNYAIVGAYLEDETPVTGDNGISSGKAYIFNVTTGALVHTLNNPNTYSTSADDRFGWSVSISGNYAIVGALGEDVPGGGASGFESGKAYIFNVTTGALLRTLDNPNPFNSAYQDYFGVAVAISGNRVIVGASGEDDAGGTSSGKAYTYTLSNTVESGYAFRFAPNTVVSTRSPYVQNVVVITKGSITSADDPRGFASGNAGQGAYIDGNSVNSASNEASMLFNSVTFITPGVDAVTMTNGVRVEWLNSFTYFANRGLYAVDGVDGHLSTDGSTVKYGAELRSIGSANVYGNYGAVADGVDTLMYLIQHNFGYIGVGKYVDNDASRAIQANEVVKLNSGKIYYQSVNHFGNFRVGEQFFIDQESGNTSIVLTEAEVDSLNGLVINSGGETSFINGNKIDIGDFIIAGNLIKTETLSVNTASANNINFTSNVAISKNLTMTGDITIGGALITLGNEATDTINFNTPFSQDIEPDISGLYNLGSANKKWIKSWLGEANIGDVQFNENYITTTVSNADLELRANATGRVYLPNNSLVINNATTINGTTDLQNVNTTGTITQTGNTTISNGASIVGAAHVTGIVTIGAKAQLENILIDGNLITTTASNSDLDLRASGTGTIRIPNNNVLVSNAFTANDITGTNLYVQSAVALNDIITSGQIKIDDNFITTTLSNSDLELRANGTGGIRIQDDILFNQNIVSTTADLNLTSTGNVNITSSSALLLPRGTSVQRQTRSGSEDTFLNAGQAPNVFGLDNLDGGTATTTTFDTVYNGSIATLSSAASPGPIRFNTVDNVFEGQSGAVVGFGGVYSADRLTSLVAHPTNDTINITVNAVAVGQVNSNGITIHGLQTDDISIQNNIIRTIVSNSNLELVRNGTGVIAITGSDITFKDNHIINSNASAGLMLSNTANGYVKFAGTGAVLFPAGTSAERGTNSQTGDTRYNSQVGYMEVYDGTSWIAAQGGGETVTSQFMEELISEWSLILG